MDDEQRRQIALWRLGVLRPLLSTEIGCGSRCGLFRKAARRTHTYWNGRRVRRSSRTIQRWFYCYQRGGLAALYPKRRSDAGRSRAIGPEVAEQILTIKRDKPHCSIRQVIQKLEQARTVPCGHLKKSSVHRLLQAHVLSTRSTWAWRSSAPGDWACTVDKATASKANARVREALDEILACLRPLLKPDAHSDAFWRDDSPPDRVGLSEIVRPGPQAHRQQVHDDQIGHRCHQSISEG